MDTVRALPLKSARIATGFPEFERFSSAARMSEKKVSEFVPPITSREKTSYAARADFFTVCSRSYTEASVAGSQAESNVAAFCTGSPLFIRARKASARTAARSRSKTPPSREPNFTPLCPIGLWLAEMYAKGPVVRAKAMISGAAATPAYNTERPRAIRTRQKMSAIGAPVGRVSRPISTSRPKTGLSRMKDAKVSAMSAVITSFAPPIALFRSSSSPLPVKIFLHPEAERMSVSNSAASLPGDGRLSERGAVVFN